MGRKVAIRHQNIKNLTNVIEEINNSNQKFVQFINKFEKIIVEFGCGRGEYVTSLAKLDSKIGCIGVDYQGERIWYGATKAIEQQIDNVLFLRTNISSIKDFISQKSVDEIWLTFPDPYPKNKHSERRLTSHTFLNIYKKILKNNGVLHLKTDSEILFNSTIDSILSYGCKIIVQNKDIYAEKTVEEKLQIKTHYEEKYLKIGKKIKYIKFNMIKGDE